MSGQRIYPTVYIEAGKIYCCPVKHVCFSDGGTNALANDNCPARIRYLTSFESDYYNRLYGNR